VSDISTGADAVSCQACSSGHRLLPSMGGDSFLSLIGGSVGGKQKVTGGQSTTAPQVWVKPPIPQLGEERQAHGHRGQLTPVPLWCRPCCRITSSETQWICQLQTQIKNLVSLF